MCEKRTEFERVAPERVGIDSRVIERFVSRMDDGFTEMHSLMIMRHGKVCAEGWWAPFAPGLPHTMMSQTKTFTGTAVGIAAYQGLLSLDEKLVDIFPEHVPEDADERVRSITVRHLLTMSSGMVEASRVDADWLRNYFSMPVLHEPGTAFFYNDSAVTVFDAVILRKSGQHLMEFLTPRLFDKIGIDARNIRWFNVADGYNFAAGGLYATTEDALRLMKLYADGGVWNGERILSEEYVRAATSCQIRTDTAETLPVGLPEDNRHGYGYLMWMGSRPETFRAEGAFGQITLVDPSRDMIVSFTESAKVLSPASQGSMDRVWEFLDEIDPQVDALPENPAAADALARRMRSLAIEAAPCAPYGDFLHEGARYQVVEPHAAESVAGPAVSAAGPGSAADGALAEPLGACATPGMAAPYAAHPEFLFKDAAYASSLDIVATVLSLATIPLMTVLYWAVVG